MTKYLRLLFLVFISYFASISLANSQPDPSKKNKTQIKKILADANKTNLKKLPESFKLIFKSNLVKIIENYGTEYTEKHSREENEEKELARKSALKIYHSLLRDQIKEKNADHKIVKKQYKTTEMLNKNEQKVLNKAGIAVENFLFNGTIIFLSILDKEEYKYVRIFLEELHLLATLSPSYPYISNFLNGAFNASAYTMQTLKEIPFGLWTFCDEKCKEIYEIGNQEENEETKTNGKYKIKNLIPLNIPGSKKVKFAVATIVITGITIPVLVYFNVENLNCLVCPSSFNSIQKFCDKFCSEKLLNHYPY